MTPPVFSTNAPLEPSSGSPLPRACGGTNRNNVPKVHGERSTSAPNGLHGSAYTRCGALRRFIPEGVELAVVITAPSVA